MSSVYDILKSVNIYHNFHFQITTHLKDKVCLMLPFNQNFVVIKMAREAYSVKIKPSSYISTYILYVFKLTLRYTLCCHTMTFQTITLDKQLSKSVIKTI